MDRRNFTLADYLAMCAAGEARLSIAEAARVMGVSRAWVYRALTFASVSEAEFEDVLDTVFGRGLTTDTAIADEIKRRTGRAQTYAETCPHCGAVIRTRTR
jgi:hypothetical protein